MSVRTKRLYAINTKSGTLAWEFQTEAAKKDALKVLNADGSLNQEAFAPLFNDFASGGWRSGLFRQYGWIVVRAKVVEVTA